MQARNSFEKLIYSYTSHKRSYFAATLKPNVKPVHAMIKEGDEERIIQIYEQDTRAEIYDEHFTFWDFPISKKNYDFLKKMNFLPHFWNNFVTLGHNGMIQITDECNRNQALYEILYAIPQVTWDYFIAQLPHQDIVQKLNLSEHRHLFSAYNYAVSTDDPEIRHFRADACGKYHFLNSAHPWDTIVDKGVIAHGKTVAEVAADYPFVTPLYLEKFSHCPNWNDFFKIGNNRILPKVKNTHGKIDKIKLNEFIAALPSSKKEPEKFSKMVSAASKLGNLFSEEKPRTYLFYQVRNNFGLFENINTHFFRDFYHSLIKDLFFPEVIRKLMGLSSTELKESGIRKIYNELDQSFSKILTEQVNIVKLQSLQERWHRNITVINSKKPQPAFVIQWHPLFSEQTINDVTFTCLTTPKQLHDEGAEMSHCVGGYVFNCTNGMKHIIKVKTASGERSTIELEVSLDGEEIKLRQNYGSKNSAPCSKIISATNVLLSRLKNNEIPLNPQRGKIEQPGFISNAITDKYPYVLTDQNTQELIYQAYKDAKVLPPFMIANNYNEMMENNDVIKNVLNSLGVEKLQSDETAHIRRMHE